MKKRIKTIAIFCNGEKIRKSVFSKFAAEIDFIICADGGADKVMHLGSVPDVITGDMDSISKNALKTFSKSKKVLKNDQNSTDLERALCYAKKLKPLRILIFGGMGDRIDHTLTNLNMLKKFQTAGNIEFITNRAKLFLTNKPVELNEKPGTVISLIPHGLVKAVTLTGFKYPLHEDDLIFGGRDGQSNIAKDIKQKIDFTRGDLLIVINF